MLPFAVIDPSLGESAALCTIVTAVGGGHLWLLKQYFVGKSQLEKQRQADEERLAKALAEVSGEAKAAAAAAAESNQKHELAKAPFQTLVVTLNEVKVSIEKSTLRADERDKAFQDREEKFLVALSNLSTRVAVIEDRADRAVRGAGAVARSRRAA